MGLTSYVGAENVAVNKTDKSSVLVELKFWWQETDTKQITDRALERSWERGKRGRVREAV